MARLLSINSRVLVTSAADPRRVQHKLEIILRVRIGSCTYAYIYKKMYLLFSDEIQEKRFVPVHQVYRVPG